MGKGLALQFKQQFPANFAAYAKGCRSGGLVPGRMHLFDTARRSPDTSSTSPPSATGATPAASMT